MGGKAKPTKHTAKEIAGKHHAAKMKAGGCGGGIDGRVKRTAPKEGKKDIFIKCEKCFVMQPSFKSLKIHFENKHPKDDWDAVEKLYLAQQKDDNVDEEKKDFDDEYYDEEFENEDGIEEEQKEGN
jgi:hypothetical protein